MERLSGRDVLAFISNHHVGPDREIELFVFGAPRDLQGQPAAGALGERVAQIPQLGLPAQQSQALRRGQ